LLFYQNILAFSVADANPKEFSVADANPKELMTMKADETLDAKQNIAQLSGSDLEDLGVVIIPMVLAQKEVIFPADLTGAAERLAQMVIFTAYLTGDAEIPPVITNGTGRIVFNLDREADEMLYFINVEGLEGILQAHIHQGDDNVNGDIVVWLFNAGEPTDEIHGELVSGSFTAEDFIGPLQGKNMSDLVDAIKNGQAYVNIHTEANLLGEVRGTIAHYEQEGGEDDGAAPIDEDEFFNEDPFM
jgi:hypothetical protein